MKTVILSLYLFCCGGYAVALEETTTEKGIAVLSKNLSTEEPMLDLNGTTSTPWIPPQSFASGAFSAFSVIAVSELGDKTFFIAVVLSLTHSPLCVFLGAISALALMTMLSACLGLVSTVIPDFWVQCLSGTLFLLFGIKMLREAYMMKSTAGRDEFEDVQKTLDSKRATKRLVEDDIEDVISTADECDDDLPTEKTLMTVGKVKAVDVEAGPVQSVFRWVFIEAFVMTFLAEWGDRSQITTVLLAAKDSVAGVIVGATLGHAACTLLAVVGGRIVADRISLRLVTIFGGILFLVFAIFCAVNAVDEYKEMSPS